MNITCSRTYRLWRRSVAAFVAFVAFLTKEMFRTAIKRPVSVGGGGRRCGEGTARYR